jgi:AcrR family transcriptional regulator
MTTSKDLCFSARRATTTAATTREARGRARPGGRSARVRAAVLAATLELLAERGYEQLELPEVARRAGVNVTTVYRRWGSKARLAGEALLERAEPLVPTPDTGTFRTDLEHLLVRGAALLRTPPVRAMFELLLSQATNPSAEIARARDRFVAAHMAEAQGIVDRAVGRSELPAGADPAALVELVIGPALMRFLLMGADVDAASAAEIAARAEAALRAPAVRAGPESEQGIRAESAS